MNLSDSEYSYKPNFLRINGLQIHYISEGEPGSPVILFLHGVPTWSFTFRNIIPICLGNGFRVIAPDLPGFGKSDKPLSRQSYSVKKIVSWMEEFIRKLELSHLFLFAHDWGAIIGMILAAENPDLFSGIVVCNGFLPLPDRKLPPLFLFWQWFAKFSPCIPVGSIISYASKNRLSKTVRSGYNLPFSNEKEKTAIRVLPQLIPVKMSDPEALLFTESWDELKRWEKPFLTVFSNGDPITRGGEKIIQEMIPGAKNQFHRILEGKHFLQEDQPAELGFIISEFVKTII